jgi:glycosyltransferase involved in cell wall biosynthesis
LSGSQVQPFVVDLVIAARNCAGSLEGILAGCWRHRPRSIVVVDRASRDSTSLVARDGGAVVLHERSGGYGAACRRATDHIAALPLAPDAVVFLSDDGSDDPAEIPRLLEPICSGRAELVVGDRRASDGGAAALPAADRIALGLIGLIYRHQFGDVGRFRAIRFPALVALGLSDRGEAWNVEMQVKALRFGLRIAEVPVARRTGQRPPASRTAELRDSVTSAGKKVFQILWHATAR